MLATMPALAAQDSAKVARRAAVKSHLQQHFKFYGFVRNYFTYDSRELIAGTGDLYNYMPRDENWNQTVEEAAVSGVPREDLNDVSTFRFLSFTTRVGVNVVGYKWRRTEFSGKIEAGSYIYNTRSGKKERVSRLFQMHSNHQNPEEVIEAGDIGAAVGFKDIRTGDTLCDEDAPIVLESMDFPDTVISIAVEPKTQKDMDKLSVGLAKLAEEDPTFTVRTDEQSGQTVISGMGELHLDIIIDRLKREFKVECNQGKPQVNYKEAITETVNLREVYKKQTGGRGKFADIIVNVGSDQLSFEVAALNAYKNACAKAHPVLMEPIMALEVVTPEENMGDVIGDLNKRRGQVEGMESGRSGGRIIKAKVPLAEMFGYVTTLRTITSGRATSSMQYDHHAPLSASIARTVLEEVNGRVDLVK